MRVFVAGASGVIGRRLLPVLVAGGHEVVGMTRSPQKAGQIAEAGAEPVVCDALDGPALDAALRAAAPEVVVHQLTAIPRRLNPRRIDRDFELTNLLRGEGTRLLVAAARAAGARRVVAQSVAFAYAPIGGRVKTEDDPLFLDAPTRTLQAIAELEETVLGAEGVVLRYGYFYGPGTFYAADGSFAEDARRRRTPIVGRGTGVWSFIHIDDAARATAKAIEGGAPGAYNVVDDEPAEVREWLPAYARALGAKPPWRVPAWLARAVGGRYAVYVMTELRGASNAKAKRELGMALDHPTWRDGFGLAAR